MNDQPKLSRIPLEMTGPNPPPQPAPEAAMPATAADAGVVLKPEEIEAIQDQVVEALRTCYDPEIPVNIHELGLIYGIDVNTNGTVEVRMTLTSPACPVAGSLPGEVQRKLQAIPGVTAAKVELVWDPPWTPERMSEAARLQLGFF